MHLQGTYTTEGLIDEIRKLFPSNTGAGGGRLMDSWDRNWLPWAVAAGGLQACGVVWLLKLVHP